MRSVPPTLHSYIPSTGTFLSIHRMDTPSTQLSVQGFFDPKSTPVNLNDLQNFDWKSSETDAKAFLDCIVNLVSFNSCYVPDAFRLLVQGFIPTRKDEGYELEMAESISQLIHITLQKIVTLVPLSSTLLATALKDEFPFKRCNAEVVFAYMKNLLRVTYYAPNLIEHILTTAVDRLIEIDVEIKLDEVPEEHEELQFEVELATSEKSDSSTSLAMKLDLMMIVMFEFFDASLGNEADEQDRKNTFVPMNLSQSLKDNLFHLLLRIFDRYILSTYKSKYTQFLLFYVCRLKAKENDSFAARFMAYLFSQIQQRTRNGTNPLACSAYLGSFLSRAAYLPAPTIREVVLFMLKWALTYASTYAHAVPDAAVHGLFYSMSQSLYYTFCFHHQSLATDDATTQHLKEGFRIVTECKLNPLKLCLPTIAREFVRVSAEIEWFNYADLLKANEKLVLATHSSFGGSNQLDMFFPFDPYLLKHSSKYLTNLYVEWTGPEEPEDADADADATPAFADDDSDEEEDGDDAGDEDDEEEEEEAKPESDDLEQLTQDFMHFTPEVEKDIRYHFSFD